MSRGQLIRKGFGIAKRGVGKAVGGIRAAADKKKRPVRGSKNLTQPAPKGQRLRKPRTKTSYEPEMFVTGVLTGGTAVYETTKPKKKKNKIVPKKKPKKK